MAKKDKKVNAWQIIVAVFQALAALFGSLKKSHDSAHESAKAESSSEDSEKMLRINKKIPSRKRWDFSFQKFTKFTKFTHFRVRVWRGAAFQ